MRILFLLNSILIFLIAGGKVHGQGYAGKIKNDSAYILTRVSSFMGLESIAEQWHISPLSLQQANPEVSTSLVGKPVEVYIPIFHLLKNNPCEGCGPVYHSVGKSEGLYRIGKWYGNQPVTVLKKRNNLRSDALTPGQQLIVGYILPAGTRPDDSAITYPMFVPKDTANGIMAVSGTEAINEIPKPAPTRKFLSYSGEGSFAPEFLQAPEGFIKKTGKASSFKSESGWTDGRFYVLNSQLKTGLVVKISNPITGIYLFAKVVGPLPDIKQNLGLSLRLNSAAAVMLGFWEDEKSFELTWEY
jgi:hypothetical protein